MIQIMHDTLKERSGKWSIKRIAGASGFYASIIYVFIPCFFPTFVIHEFVFLGFISFSATAIGMTVWNKKIDK